VQDQPRDPIGEAGGVLERDRRAQADAADIVVPESEALDEGLEFICYNLVRTELPDTILVSVSHRSTVEQHHTHELELLGDGEWRLGRVEGGDPVPV